MYITLTKFIGSLYESYNLPSILYFTYQIHWILLIKYIGFYLSNTLDLLLKFIEFFYAKYIEFTSNTHCTCKEHCIYVWNTLFYTCKIHWILFVKYFALHCTIVLVKYIAIIQLHWKDLRNWYFTVYFTLNLLVIPIVLVKNIAFMHAFIKLTLTIITIIIYKPSPTPYYFLPKK